MSRDQLDNFLPIVNGALTLTANSLPGTPLRELLDLYNGGQPLTISHATKKRTQDGVTVSGTAPFMNVPSLDVVANFTLDAKGTPTATLRFTLIEAQPGPNPWHFSHSFQQLPAFNKDIAITQPTFLDTLALAQAAFVLTTLQDGQDSVTNAPLSFGLNFVGRLKPTGLTGLFDSLLGGKQTVTLYGKIIIAPPGQITPPLPVSQSPWEASWLVPGIHLQADIGIDLSLAKSKLRFHDTTLRIYSSLSADWLHDNGTYVPMIAVVGRLDVASANISVNLSAKLQPNVRVMTLAGTFQGVSLENLGKLTDLSGGSDLLALLPDELKQGGHALGSLSLEAVGISFIDSLSPSNVYITVGMPDVHLTMLPGFTVESVAANFAIGQPFSGSPSFYTTLEGTIQLAGAPLDLSLELPDLIGRATLKAGVVLPLSDLFKELSLPAPADLSIETMDLIVVAGQGYSFNANLADNPPWELDLGRTPMIVKDVQLAVSHNDAGNTQGAFGGTVQFSDDLSLAMNYNLPGDFIIRADLPEVKLSELISRLNETGLDLVPGFDITLAQSYVLITKQGNDLTFSAATDVENFGLLAFTAERQGQWGFAVGMDVGGAGLSAIPGLEALAAFESFIGLEKIMLVVSSLDAAGFTFPDMANFNAPALGNRSLSLPAQASGLVRGMNIYAALSTSKGEGFRALAKFLNIELDGSVGITLAISLPDPQTNSKLFISVNEVIQPGTTLKGELGLLMQGTDVAVFLTADVKTQVQGQPMEFDVTALVLPNGVLISGSMKGTISFGPVQLSNLALIIGIDLEGIPSLGIAATLDIVNFDSSVALFFDSADPAKSMVSGAVSDLSLLEVAKSFAGQNSIPGGLDAVLGMFALKGLNAFDMPATVAAALDSRDLGAISSAFQQYGKVAIPATSDGIMLVVNTKGSVWHLTDMTTMLHYSLTRQGDTINVALEAQFYCAPQSTFIGAIQFPEGFHVVAEIDYLLLQAQIKILINPSQGIAADIDISPILIFSQSFFALTGANGQGGPRLSLSTYEQPTLTDEQLRAPHFMLSGDLRVLGIDLSDAYVSINEHGLEFQLGEQVSPLMRVDLHGKFDSLTNLDAGGSIVVGINRGLDLGPLGHISVDVNVNGSVDIGYQGGSAHASFQGGFVFQGIDCNIPQISLDVSGPALQNIAETLWSEISDIISKLLLDADRWLSWLKDNLISGVGQTAEEVGKVLSDVYRLSSDEIAQKTTQILSYGVEQTAQALKGAGVAAEAAVGALQNAGYQTAEIASAIPNVFTGAHVDTSFGHIDTPAGPHVDTPGAPHVDTPGAPHVDTPGAPHVDLAGQHSDFSTHTDHGTFMGHWDTSIGHSDMQVTPHVDTQAYPHIDTSAYPHVDTAAYPHVDMQTPPHGDTGTHIDT